MVIDWDPSCFSSCSSNWVTCSFWIVFHRSFGHILVTCILILHFLCEHLYPGTQNCQSSSTAYRQLDNNQLHHSESQKSVLRQETVCTFCWLWDNAPNVIVILGASVCPGVGCYNWVLLSLGKPHSPKYFSIVIYASPLICKAYL